MLVASDGTGNFASVQAAVNALPVPGDRSTSSQAHTTGSLRWCSRTWLCAGSAAIRRKVILTHEAGAFGSNLSIYRRVHGRESATAISCPRGSTSFYGRWGLATLVCREGNQHGHWSRRPRHPDGFYAENLTLINTYNTDTTTTTTTYVTRLEAAPARRMQGRR